MRFRIRLLDGHEVTFSAKGGPYPEAIKNTVKDPEGILRMHLGGDEVFIPSRAVLMFSILED